LELKSRVLVFPALLQKREVAKSVKKKPTFVKLNRTEETEYILKHHPNAYLLLSLIAIRARRSPNFLKDLDLCEAMIGDYKSCGLSHQQSRTALKYLEDNNLIHTCATNKGTVVKLINSDVFDINVIETNKQSTNQNAPHQHADNKPPNTKSTTNKNDKNIKNERIKEERRKHTSEFETFWKAYPNKKGKDKALKKWLVYKPDINDVIKKLDLFIKYEWAETEPKYVPHGSTFVNQKRWEDEIKIPDDGKQSTDEIIIEALNILKEHGEKPFIGYCQLQYLNPDEIRPN